MDELDKGLAGCELETQSGSDSAFDPFVRFSSFEHYPYYQFLLRKKDSCFSEAYFRLHEDKASAIARIGGQEFISFSSFNYLSLNGDPRIADATIASIQRYGTSVCASRLISGERAIHRELEQELADFFGVESAMVFVSGNGTNVTTIGYLFGSKDVIFYDELIHNSVIQGAQLSGARRIAFPHNDWQALEELLTTHRRQYERALIVVEGMYSMDGDFPDLPEFVRIKKNHHAFLMVDEAHSLGVMGETGRGITEHFSMSPSDVDIWMGTLSKALASSGGYIAGSHVLVNHLKYAAPGFLFSVGVAPHVCAAALAALKILQQEPERIVCLRERGLQFLQMAKALGLDTGFSKGFNIVSVICGRSQHAMAVSLELFKRGINAHPILFPAVPRNKERVRFFINSAHTPEQITYTVKELALVMELTQK